MKMGSHDKSKSLLARFQFFIFPKCAVALAGAILLEGTENPPAYLHQLSIEQIISKHGPGKIHATEDCMTIRCDKVVAHLSRTSQ